MLPADLGRPPKEASGWDKWGVFSLALVCILSVAGFGTWGKMRMMADDNSNLTKKLETETEQHKQVEAQLTKRLRHRRGLFNHLARELDLASAQFQAANETLKAVQTKAENAIRHVKNESMPPSEFVSKCVGVAIPSGFSYLPKGFPHDLLGNATGLRQLLKSDDKLAPLLSLTGCLGKKGLLSHPTYPWGLWTWLRAWLDRPKLVGNFTEWGVGSGGASMFLGRLASLRGGSLAGMDTWDSSKDAKQQQLQHSAHQCNITLPMQTKFYDLSKQSISWPEAGRHEKIAFSHIQSDDYSTTLGVLDAVYDNTVDGGMLAVDNFFGASGASKRAVKQFFDVHTPGQSPLIFPVFPGSSVLIFKGRFANPAKGGDHKNELDGNFYSFELIKGHQEIIDAVSGSAATLHQAHMAARQDSSVNQTSLCWLSLALQKVLHLRDFVSTPSHIGNDFEDQDLFDFMSSTFNDNAAAGTVASS